MKTAFSYDLGQFDYKSCWELQQTLFDSLIRAKRSGEKWDLRLTVDGCQQLSMLRTTAEGVTPHAPQSRFNEGETSVATSQGQHDSCPQNSEVHKHLRVASLVPKESIDFDHPDAPTHETTRPTDPVVSNFEGVRGGHDNSTELQTANTTAERNAIATQVSDAVTEQATSENEEQRVIKNTDTDNSDTVGIVLTVEHPPVYTLGKNGKSENLLINQASLEQLGAQFFHIDRGGDITFHGIGQLVCYPILDLEKIGLGLRHYIEALEEAVIRTVADYGIRAGRIQGASGVWIGGETFYGNFSGRDTQSQPAVPADSVAGAISSEGDLRQDRPADGTMPHPATTATTATATEATEATAQKATTSAQASARRQDGHPRKICAIGVRSSRFVTMHGFALNVNTDLGWFTKINPCGFTDRGVTSIAKECGHEVAMEDVKQLVLNHLSEILNVKIYKY